MYDAIELLLRKLLAFLGRLEVYLRPSSPPGHELQKIFVKILLQLVIVLAIFTKYCKEGVDKESKAKKFMAVLFRRTSKLYL
jgi:hypothetical protein